MHFYILPCLFLIFPINLAQANMGIPGPMILFGSYFTMNPIQWVCVCMLMCIFVEGFIYKYWRLFSKPFWVSAYVNTISLIFGSPLSFLGIIDPTWVILPTLGSTLIEGYFARRLPKCLRPKGLWKNKRGTFYARIFLANLISNAIMFAYLFKNTITN